MFFGEYITTYGGHYTFYQKYKNIIYAIKFTRNYGQGQHFNKMRVYLLQPAFSY